MTTVVTICEDSLFGNELNAINCHFKMRLGLSTDVHKIQQFGQYSVNIVIPGLIVLHHQPVAKTSVFSTKATGEGAQ